MIVVHTLEEYKSALNSIDSKLSIGFVPTMGALHQGHLSLIQQSVKENDCTVISIFVNPTQFNNADDFQFYPRTLENDCTLVKECGVDIVFAPGVSDIYPSEDKRVYNLGGLDAYSEGPRRPGHFNGVAQVVTRLFDIVKPTRAYFGEKDFQQLAIIEYITSDLNYPIEIVRCPTSRYEDGLARSSRNELLTPKQREAAPHIYKTISSALTLMDQMSPEDLCAYLSREINTNSELETEYIEIFNAKTLEPLKKWGDAEHIQLACAVFARPVRLIDNIKLK